MKTLNPQQQSALNASIGNITDFVMANKGQCMPWADTREKLLRYTSHCFVFGKLAVAWENNLITAVVYYWPEHFERLEAKVAENLPIFNWEPPRAGDCLFVADCIGNRHAIGKLWHGTIEKWPNLIGVGIYTLRKNKLHKLSIPLLERFAP